MLPFGVTIPATAPQRFGNSGWTYELLCISIKLHRFLKASMKTETQSYNNMQIIS
jgi:hypothetical protein